MPLSVHSCGNTPKIYRIDYLRLEKDRSVWGGPSCHRVLTTCLCGNR